MKHPEPGFLCCYCHWPTMGTWAGHVPSQGLSFSICTMGGAGGALRDHDSQASWLPAPQPGLKFKR